MIVVADSTRARIFTADSGNSPLNEIETLAHPVSRIHDRDITSDLPGKGSGGDNSSGHAYQDETDPKKYELIRFAKRVANYVEDARKANQISGLIVVAAPAFLGELRTQLSNETNKKIIFELDKNLTHCSNEDIRQHLPKFFAVH
jgi:protein required for attachment to host cells